MLRSCPSLRLVGTRFALFRASATWLLIFTFGTGFLFFMAISLVISHFYLMTFSTFFRFLVLWGLLGCPIFLLVFVLWYNFQVWWRLCWFSWGIQLGGDVVCPPNPVFDFLELYWSELLLSFYIPTLVGQVVSVDIRFGILVLIVPNLSGVVFTW